MEDFSKVCLCVASFVVADHSIIKELASVSMLSHEIKSFEKSGLIYVRQRTLELVTFAVVILTLV